MGKNNIVKLLIFSIMTLSGFGGFSQKNNFEIIAHNVTKYEFSKTRERIYYIINDAELYVYDAINKSNWQIKLTTDENIEEEYLSGLLISVSDTLYVIGEKYIYSIYKNTVTNRVLYLSNIVELKKDAELWDEKEKRINDFMKNPNIRKIEKLSTYYIETLIDNSKIAAHESEFNYADKELIKTFTKSVQKIDLQDNTSYSRKNKGHKRLINRFENSNITIKERKFSCELFGGLFVSPKCKYKMKIKTDNKRFVLKDKVRRSGRYIARGWGKGKWNCNLYERIPYSNYITDINNKIYLLFFNNEENESYDLIKTKNKK